MSVSFESLLTKVSQGHNDIQIEVLKPIINSFVWKFFISNYHANESKDITRKLIPKSSKKESVEILKLLFEGAAGTDKGKQFGVAIFKAEAHLIAFAQSIHSLADIFAQIIYISLNLDVKLDKPIKLKFRTISKINECISNLTEHTKLHSEINYFLESKQFKYLNAYVNTTKHRSLIPVNYSVSFIESLEPIHGLKIAKFTYDDCSFEPRFSNELIEETLVYFEKSYNSILAELNNLLNVK